ncbi:DUF6270 domain-containing protein [Brevibacterium jeotgali]|uniref:Uncharacterized protein n=1 Tax=Brevibacterium jeotgali TaxID=1262550 RepID=A0A2H1L8P1_9MICO|nr:DUF6270 domain-containing protein [Brevibacterium jeotgali]TWC03406.1 hypothetical protein FB108_2134 [Brevibacterium jeotgali]SMY13229.1 hypothetical protein BJEO58_02841 [Brevibacterium jeotgali]
MALQNDPPRIDIWGSCVSRDTLEFMPDVEVGAYVARQSAIVSLSPAIDLPVPIDSLESEFQRRMLTGDTVSNAKERVGQPGSSVVLVDLVDERRGVWQFRDNTFLTNSVEAYRTGVDEWADGLGARLIPFGTDEHFDLWKRGFASVAEHITSSGVPIVLLNVAWAEVFEGQMPPRRIMSRVSSVSRRGQRGLRGAVRAFRRERTLRSGIDGFRSAPRSPGDEYVRIAREANEKFERYVSVARDYATVTISRVSDDVRMNKSHRWGIGPYHYSDNDYRSLSRDVRKVLRHK